MITMKKYLIRLTVFLSIGILALVTLNLYFRDKATKNFIETLDSLVIERDSTNSLRNWEVLNDSINNLCKKWCNDEASK